MKIKPGFMLREVAGHFIVVPVGKATASFNGLIKLNETGAFLWEALQDKASITKLVKKLISNYDVDENTAKQDVDEFINKLLGADLLE